MKNLRNKLQVQYESEEERNRKLNKTYPRKVQPLTWERTMVVTAWPQRGHWMCMGRRGLTAATRT
eukprot:evm.model.NODE_16214_length_9855_cov_43.101166.1